MMRIALATPLLALSACSTTGLLSQPADRTYHSSRSADIVADCVMNRIASGDFRVRQEHQGGVIIVRVTGAIGTYFVFALRASPAVGTDIEMRRANSMAPGLHNAETCF